MARPGENAVRIQVHPILGAAKWRKKIRLIVDGEIVEAFEGEPIATALIAAGRRAFRYSPKRGEPRGVFCALGRCTDCMMTVDGRPNVRTCVTPAREGMIIETQEGLGQWDNAKKQGTDEE